MCLLYDLQVLSRENQSLHLCVERLHSSIYSLQHVLLSGGRSLVREMPTSWSDGDIYDV